VDIENTSKNVASPVRVYTITCSRWMLS